MSLNKKTSNYGKYERQGTEDKRPRKKDWKQKNTGTVEQSHRIGDTGTVDTLLDVTS